VGDVLNSPEAIRLVAAAIALFLALCGALRAFVGVLRAALKLRNEWRTRPR
jgi:hypothetical protein